MSDASQSPSPKSDIVRYIFLWRRKKLASMVLFISTATWVLLQVYQFNFITVASWVAISIVALLFLWGNLLRLLRKEEPNLSGLEITEEFSMEAANSCREVIEEAIRWMFRVSAEREHIEFAATVGGLWLISYVGSLFDLLTLLYIGNLDSLSVYVSLLTLLYIGNQEDFIRRLVRM